MSRKTFQNLILLFALSALVLATPAHAVGAGCRSTEGPGDDGRTVQRSDCQAAGRETPAEATPTLVFAVASAHGALVATGLCPPDGDCTFGNQGGPSVEFSSTSRNGTHEFKGHVTLIR